MAPKKDSKVVDQSIARIDRAIEQAHELVNRLNEVKEILVDEAKKAKE